MRICYFLFTFAYLNWLIDGCKENDNPENDTI